MQKQEKMDRVYRVAHVEDATLIMGINKSEFSKPKKEIRHRLDNQKHNDTTGRVHFVDSDYEFKVVEREDILEIIIYKMDLTIRMSKHIPEHNTFSVIRNTLEAPPSVVCVGMFDVREHYTREL